MFAAALFTTAKTWEQRSVPTDGWMDKMQGVYVCGWVCVCVCTYLCCCSVAKSCPTLWPPCGLKPARDFPVHGISQARYWSGLPFPSPCVCVCVCVCVCIDGILLSHKKNEIMPFVAMRMELEKSEKDKYHMTSFMTIWQMNLPMKQNHRRREQTCDCWGREEGWREREASGGELFHTEWTWDAPGGSAAKTPHSQCSGPRFNPWPGSETPRVATKSVHVTTKDPSGCNRDWRPHMPKQRPSTAK